MKLISFLTLFSSTHCSLCLFTNWLQLIFSDLFPTALNHFAMYCGFCSPHTYAGCQRGCDTSIQCPCLECSWSCLSLNVHFPYCILRGWGCCFLRKSHPLLPSSWSCCVFKFLPFPSVHTFFFFWLLLLLVSPSLLIKNQVKTCSSPSCFVFVVFFFIFYC